uniref:Uncharacterized protein n=1 Tax=Anopheles maculatus TaxID=74869 RepID=A0A182STU9_9DIPT
MVVAELVATERAMMVVPVFRWFDSVVKHVQKIMYSILQQKSGDTDRLPHSLTGVQLPPVKEGNGLCCVSEDITIAHEQKLRKSCHSTALCAPSLVTDGIKVGQNDR